MTPLTVRRKPLLSKTFLLKHQQINPVRQIAPRVTPMSLTQRLKQMQQIDNSSLLDLSHLQLEDFEGQLVGFGKFEHSTYQEAWKDQEWINFVASRFAKSTKETHRRMIRYVELKLEWHEANQTPIVRTPSTSGAPPNLAQQPPLVHQRGARAKTTAKAVAAPSTRAPVTTHLPDMESDEWEMDSVTFPSGYTASIPVDQDPNFLDMQERMTNMEHLMNRVIQHLDSQATRTPHEPTEP